MATETSLGRTSSKKFPGFPHQAHEGRLEARRGHRVTAGSRVGFPHLPMGCHPPKRVGSLLWLGQAGLEDSKAQACFPAPWASSQEDHSQERPTTVSGGRPPKGSPKAGEPFHRVKPTFALPSLSRGPSLDQQIKNFLFFCFIFETN